MPRSSRHKSSKHSKEYSDSERDSGLKERKGKEERDSTNVRVSKESGSGEKRKLVDLSKEKENSKDPYGSGDGGYLEESSSKKRKERGADDGVSDRWNGGGEAENKGQGTKKSSKEKEKEKEKEKMSESRSKRRDGSVEKSSGKGEGKHRESGGRKEGRENEREREKDKQRKGKELKSERIVVDGDDLRAGKQTPETTELNTSYQLQSPDVGNHLDRLLRKQRDGSGDEEKHQNDVGDVNEKQIRSQDDGTKDGRLKDEKQRDDRYRDRYRDEADGENRRKDEKQRDERVVRDHVNSRSDEKLVRDVKDAVEIRQKKSKPQDTDHEREHEHDCDYDFTWDKDQDRDLDRYRERVRDPDRNRGREHDKDQDRDHDRTHDHWDWNRERDRDRDWDRDRERGRDKDRDYEINPDYEGSYSDDRSARYKDSRGRKRSPDDRDDHSDAKPRGMRATYSDIEKKTISSSRGDTNADRGRSQSRPAHIDSIGGTSRRRSSPDTISHVAGEDYRNFKEEELKHRDNGAELSKVIASRESSDFSVATERTSRYRSTEKPVKTDEGHVGELPLERSSSCKASPLGLMDRSPSNVDRRYVSRNGARRSVDIEESGRRINGSMSGRDIPFTEDRLGRDSPLDKLLVDESTPADTSFYNRNNQSSSSLIPPLPFRGRAGSPSFMGSLEEDGRSSTSSRLKRSGDPNLGRGPGNVWRGLPNWSSTVANGYMPYQHAPAHGAFQGIMPHFPTPMFGVRPSMETNHSGIPYHISDTDRFITHMRPLGWQNVMDGSSHLHEWDGNNGVFRDETHIYGGPEWNQNNRHPMNSRGWESTSELWKGQNGDLNIDQPSASRKEDFPVHASSKDVSSGQAGQQAHVENHNGLHSEIVQPKPGVTSLSKEPSNSSLKTAHERMLDPPKKLAGNNNGSFYSAYFSKLDISTELAGPELYGQCMRLISMEQVAAVEESTTMVVYLKDGVRVVPKSSTTMVNPSLFPVTNVTVFQRAMDIYKKQRVGYGSLPIVNGGAFNTISTLMVDPLPVDGSKVREPVVNCDNGVADVSPVIQGKSDEAVLTITQKVLDPGFTPSLEMLEQGLHDGQERDKLVQVSSGNEIDASETAKLENVVEDIGPTINNVPKDTSILGTDGHDMNDSDKIDVDPQQCAEEGQVLGEPFCGPLFFSDGSPMASGALMPGSNESESVIISRIHHSPESTH